MLRPTVWDERYCKPCETDSYCMVVVTCLRLKKSIYVYRWQRTSREKVSEKEKTYMKLVYTILLLFLDMIGQKVLIYFFGTA